VRPENANLPAYAVKKLFTDKQANLIVLKLAQNIKSSEQMFSDF